MGLQAVYQKPKTTAPHPEHKIWPHLLRDMVINRPKQVWCTDITYIPMRRGFLHLVAVMDCTSRRVLAWRLSNTMDVEFCIEALEEAMALRGRFEIFNTDQGSQFTSLRFTTVLTEVDIRVSMDGRGRWMDNLRRAYTAPLARWSLRSHRTALAINQIRVRLPQRLRDRQRGQGRDRSLDRLLLHRPAPLGVRRQTPRRGPPGPPGQNPCGGVRQT